MTNTTPSIAFIGAGNMGQSLIKGLIASHYPSKAIWAAEPESGKLLPLAKNFGIHTTEDNIIAAQNADIIVLATKPQIMPMVTAHLAKHITYNKLIISIAAGIRLQTLEKWFSKNHAIIRCMPNTPAMVSKGASALLANTNVSEAQKHLSETLFKTVGAVVWVESDEQMDTVTALSGSGPAYFFLLMELLEKGAIELGLPKEVAHTLTLQTASGAAALASQSLFSLEELRQNVTSPGGTTAAALQIFEQGGLGNLVQKALLAAKLRAEELSQAAESV